MNRAVARCQAEERAPGIELVEAAVLGRVDARVAGHRVGAEGAHADALAWPRGRPAGPRRCRRRAAASRVCRAAVGPPPSRSSVRSRRSPARLYGNETMPTSMGSSQGGSDRLAGWQRLLGRAVSASTRPPGARRRACRIARQMPAENGILFSGCAQRARAGEAGAARGAQRVRLDLGGRDAAHARRVHPGSGDRGDDRADPDRHRHRQRLHARRGAPGRVVRVDGGARPGPHRHGSRRRLARACLPRRATSSRSRCRACASTAR